MPRPRAALLTAVIAVAAVAALAATAALTHRRQAFTLGVPNGIPVKVSPGSDACQTPIAVPDDGDFEGVTFSLGTGGGTGPAIDVRVRDGGERGAVLRRARVAAGYPDVDRVPQHTAWVGRVGAGRTIAVCFANRGPRDVWVLGNAAAASRTSNTTIDGKVQDLDLNLAFERREPRSLASLVPAIFARAALFRAGWVGTWTYVVLAVLVLIGLPIVLVRAVAAADHEDRGATRPGA